MLVSIDSSRIQKIWFFTLNNPAFLCSQILNHSRLEALSNQDQLYFEGTF